MECYPDSEMAEEYRTLAEQILTLCRKGCPMLKRVGGEINPEGAVTTISKHPFQVPFPMDWNSIHPHMETGILYTPEC